MGKIPNYDSIPTFLPVPHAKFHVYRGNVSPLRGEKSIFGLLTALRRSRTVSYRA